VHASLERGFLSLATFAGACAWIGLVSAELGVFRPWPVLAVAAVGAVALGIVRWTSVRPPDPGPSADPLPMNGADASGTNVRDDRAVAAHVVLGFLLLLAVVRFFPPFDTTLWAADASVYQSYAHQIDRSHALVFDDPLLGDVPPQLRRELFSNREAGDVTGSYTRFPGGLMIPDIDDGRVTAGFSPVFPVLVAVFQGAFGVRAGLFVAPVFAVLGVLAVFFVGWRLAGPIAGLLAGGLLALSLPQMWFARFGMPAVVAQSFVFAGLLALLAARGRRLPALAALGGSFFGLAVLTKFDLLFVLAVAVMGFAAHALLAAGRDGGGTSRDDEARVTASFCVVFGLFLVHVALHYLVMPSHYGPFVQRMLATVLGGRVTVPDAGSAAFRLLLVAALAATGASLLWLFRGASGRAARLAGSGLVVLIGGYVAAYLTVSDNRVSETVVWLSWYLSWPLLALLPLALAAWWMGTRGERPRRSREAVVLILLGAAALHYVYDPHEATRHIWSMRRFVPVVIPALLLVVSGFVATVAQGAPRRVRWLLAASAIVAGGYLVAAPSRLVAPARPWDAAAEQARAAARTFPPGAVVLVSDDLAGTHLATALTYLYDTDAIVVRSFYPDPAVLQALSIDLLGRGREVLLALGRDFHFDGPRLALRRLPDLEIRLPVLESTVSRPPRQEVTLASDVAVFRVEQSPGQPRAYVDIGNRADDTLYRMSGLLDAERDPAVFDGSFRWTEATAIIGVPSADELELLLAGARPAGVPPAVVSIWIGGQPVVQDLTLADSPQSIRVTNPAPGGGRTELRITSTVFVPERVGDSTDARRLGVRLYGVRLDPPVCCND